MHSPISLYFRGSPMSAVILSNFVMAWHSQKRVQQRLDKQIYTAVCLYDALKRSKFVWSPKGYNSVCGLAGAIEDSRFKHKKGNIFLWEVVVRTETKS